jgi:hypothetical protein
MEWVNKGLVLFFTQPWAVPLLVIAILVGCGAILVRNGTRHHAPMTKALKARLGALAPIEQAEDVGTAQTRFAADFQQIDEAMCAEDGRPALAHAWLEYAETVVDAGEPVIRTTARPDEYLHHLGDDTRVLAWWANLFVAIGLTFTFLGIVAALSYTSENLNGADSSRMSGVLTTLLALTAAKFWTSIAGVGASIALRIFDRRWHSATGQGLARLAHAIERGTVYLPPQRIAVEQLHELKQQSTAMSEFTTQLAVGISDALADKMQPLVIGLSGIQKSIDDFKDGASASIGKAVGESAGAQMDALGSALAAMTVGLQGVNERLESGGRDAGDQIASAAKEFAVASDGMRRAFGELNDNIATMADKLVAQASDAADLNVRRVAEERDAFDGVANGNRQVMRDMADEMRRGSTEATGAMVDAVRRAVTEAVENGNAATRQALQDFSGASQGMVRALDAMQGRIAEMGDKLAGSASNAADRNAEVLAKAAAALEQAAAQAQNGLTKAASDAASRSADANARVIESAFADFAKRFDDASAGLTATLTTTAARMEALAGAIGRSTDAAGEHAARLGEANREVSGASQLLGRAANDLQAASAPVREATDAIRRSVDQSAVALTRAGEHAQRSETSIGTIARSLSETSDAAGKAWTDYRARFQGVDEALGEALDRIANASREHADQLTVQVGRMDKALAESVDRLHTALDQLSDLAAALEDQRTARAAR